MESLEGYSYYDTPRGPQYIRNSSNETAADDRRRGPLKYHPYAQSRRYDRMTNSPTQSPENDRLPVADRNEYSPIYGIYNADTVNPHALTSSAQMTETNIYQDSSMNIDSTANGQQSLPYKVEWQKPLEITQPPFHFSGVQNSYGLTHGGYDQAEQDNAQTLLDALQSSVMPSISESHNRPISAGSHDVQESHWVMGQGPNYDQSGAYVDSKRLDEQSFDGSFQWAKGTGQDLILHHPQSQLTQPGQMRASASALMVPTPGTSLGSECVDAHSPSGISVKSHTPDMHVRHASTALTAASFPLPSDYITPGGTESYIDQTLFEYAPFYDFPRQHTSQQVTPVAFDILSSNVAAGEAHSATHLPDDQDRPVPMVGLVGGYFPPDDEASMYPSPQFNSQGNIRISRLPVKKLSVVYDVPEVSDMTVSQLKTELKRRNLPAVGKKSELQARLKPHMNIQV